MTTTERKPLTRARIIDAAVEYADENGIDDLSMRKLGAVLGVEAMSLYNHVENKDDIYDGMIDYVFSSIELPTITENWRDGIRVVGQSSMEVFGKHNWVVFLLMQRGNFGPSALRFMDSIVAVLLAAGLSEEDTHHAWQMLASHTMGYAFQSANDPGRAKIEADHIERAIREHGDEFPHVAALGPYVAGCDWGVEYLFGLELILDGLESRLN